MVHCSTMEVWMAGTAKKLVQEGFWESALWGAHIHSPRSIVGCCSSSQPANSHISSVYHHNPPVSPSKDSYFNLWTHEHNNSYESDFLSKNYQQIHWIQSNKRMLVCLFWYMFFLVMICRANWIKKHFLIIYNNWERISITATQYISCK